MRVDLRAETVLIGPFDKLVIDVFGVRRIEHEGSADRRGRTNYFPLAGTREAAGKTPKRTLVEIGGSAARSVCSRPADGES
jgi:polysaccharide export outer membrane protein